MLISIITPNFNSIKYIEKTWQSIKNQNHNTWEWLVIDDGSTDGSLEFLQELYKCDTRIQLYKRKNEPKGASTCRNIGINNATGEYLMFLDADDLLHTTCLANRLEMINASPELDFGVFNMGMFKDKVGDSEEVINKYCENNEDYLVLFLSYQLPWPITSPFWKRSFIQDNNIRFSKNYQRLQDPEFHSKILLCHHPKFKVFKESEPDCYYRQPHKRIKRTKTDSLIKLTNSVLLYYKEIIPLINENKPDYINYLDSFTIKIFHSLLFYTKLSKVRPVTDLYRKMNLIRQVNKLSISQIRLFAFLNILGLTFLKGAGVSRLWKTLNS